LICFCFCADKSRNVKTQNKGGGISEIYEFPFQQIRNRDYLLLLYFPKFLKSNFKIANYIRVSKHSL
jgi:hypothetical protein